MTVSNTSAPFRCGNRTKRRKLQRLGPLYRDAGNTCSGGLTIYFRHLPRHIFFWHLLPFFFINPYIILFFYIFIYFYTIFSVYFFRLPGINPLYLYRAQPCIDITNLYRWPQFYKGFHFLSGFLPKRSWFFWNRHYYIYTHTPRIWIGRVGGKCSPICFAQANTLISAQTIPTFSYNVA